MVSKYDSVNDEHDPLTSVSGRFARPCPHLLGKDLLTIDALMAPTGNVRHRVRSSEEAWWLRNMVILVTRTMI